MNSSNFQIEDLLTSESFFNWVKKNNSNDTAFWDTWWKENPEHQDLAREAINIIKSISFEDKGFSSNDLVELWNHIKTETIESTPIHPLKKDRPSTVWSSLLMKVAAVTLPVLLASVLYLTHHQTAKEQDHFTQEMIIKEIPRGQKLTIYLPDGSRVKLNAESRISYPKPFDEDQRVVTLDGEAFFEVTPNQTKPFLVLSEGIETRVVGTSFNVNAYPDDDHVEISVVTGEVEVKKISEEQQNARPIVLLPTEQATYSTKEDKAVVSGFDSNKVLGWKEGTLYFNNASMNEFVAELERWYGIEIVVARKMPIKKGIVGEFRNQSLEEILIGLHSASEFEYEFVNGKLIIK